MACQREAGWQRAVRALNLFRPDGQLNERGGAEQEIAAAVAVLEGPRWAKTRRMLSDARTRTFLDRLHRELAAAEPRAELREALVGLWRLRHATRPGCGPLPVGSCGVLAPVVAALVCGRLESDWQGAYREVARVVRGVVRGVVRASSVVECLNSVVRMHQARQKTLSQALLDLKRLYWNCREFREGKRAQSCPYEHLGLDLPSYDWWDLLLREPDHIQPKLSPAPMAA